MLGSEKEIGSFLSRHQLLEKLKRLKFDILIIGGGAVGSGAALDAATRGLKTALVEANDFSSGTSSRSTKLIHGGVRYLENAVKNLNKHEYALVRDALKERKRFLENAPHLTNALPILTPVYSWFEAFYYLIGLKLYDLVAGKASLGVSKFLLKKSALSVLPMMKKTGLKGAVLYYDGQFDDARMNITLILSALRAGAVAVNYTSVESLIKEHGKTVGAIVRDHESQLKWPIYAKAVINATGTFADTIREMDDQKTPKIIIPSQGSHILLSEKFSHPKSGLIIPKTKDGRVVFLLPWLGKTLVGTTDQPQEISFSPKATNEEVEYILDHIGQYFDVPITRADVIATWSGLRPLVKPSAAILSTAAISRDHIIDIGASHLITIVGGKWTTYRKMGEDVVNTAIAVAKLNPLNDSLTKNLKLVGAQFFKQDLVSDSIVREGLDLDIAVHLSRSYGDRALTVINLNNQSLRARLLGGFPYIEAEAVYAATHEYALHATDVLARRMRLAFLDNSAAQVALPKIVALMGKELKWDNNRIRQEIDLATQFLDSMLTKPIPSS